MCGRGRLAADPDTLLVASGATKWRRREDYRPSNNIGPGSRHPVLCKESGSNDRLLDTMRFGLIPGSQSAQSPPDFFRMFNARSETFQQLASFRRAAPCAVPLQGFYEWGSRRQPFYVYPKGITPVSAARVLSQVVGATEGGSERGLTLRLPSPTPRRKVWGVRRLSCGSPGCGTRGQTPGAPRRTASPSSRELCIVTSRGFTTACRSSWRARNPWSAGLHPERSRTCAPSEGWCGIQCHPLLARLRTTILRRSWNR